MGKKEDQGNKLLDAAEAGDADVIHGLIKEGADLEYTCDMSWTALIYASQEGHAAIVQALVSAGANVLYETPKGKSALSVAKNQTIKTILENHSASILGQSADVKEKQVPLPSVQEGEFSFADMIAADKIRKELTASSIDNIPSVRSFVSMTLLCDNVQRALDFYVSVLGFYVVHDSGGDEASRTAAISAGRSNKDGGPRGGLSISLSTAKTNAQQKCVGKQCGDGILGTVYTDNVSRDYEDWITKGVTFTHNPHEGACGTVAVFEDLYGNKFELIDDMKRK